MEGQQVPDTDNSDSVKSKRWLKLPISSTDFWLIFSIIVMLLSLVWFFYAIRQQKYSGPKPISVVSAQALSGDVPIYFSALGTVSPTITVTVKTQINGILLQVPFKEGQLVKAGDLLAQIDPRPYEALLTQYEGNLKRDTALLNNAKIDLKRYQILWKQDSVSQQTLATQKSLVEQYEGAIKIDQGLIQSTQVSLNYCRIVSPIDGRIGLRLVDQGNFVQISDTNGIAVINTINPINVVFSIPEDYVPQIIPQVYADKTLEVLVYDRQQNQLLATGQLISIDNHIDTSTGTIKLKASFDNKDNKLFPNQFVNVKILVQTLKKATQIPTAAIKHTESGDFVYLLNKDQSVRNQFVEIGPVHGNFTVIKSGITPGQSVIVEGTDNLVNGSKVLEVKNMNSSILPKISLNDFNSRSLS